LFSVSVLKIQGSGFDSPPGAVLSYVLTYKQTAERVHKNTAHTSHERLHPNSLQKLKLSNFDLHFANLD